jgi:hypothetical protein
MRMESAKFFVAGCACVFGACVAIETRMRAAVCVSRSPSATADLQSIESKHYTSNEGNARLSECASNTLAGVPAADRPGFTTDHRFD